jgi:hypothetical protein
MTPAASCRPGAVNPPPNVDRALAGDQCPCLPGSGWAGSPAQPLPHRPRRGRTRLCPGRTARPRQRRRHPAGHQLVVAAQGLQSPRARHASSQPRGGPPARHRRGPPAQRPAGHPKPGSGVSGPQPGRSPSARTIAGRAIPVGPPGRAVRHPGPNVVVELYSETHARKASTRRGRSSVGPTALTGWSANVPADPTAATPTEPTAPADPSNPRSGRWWPMPADLCWLDQPDGESRVRACCLA